MQKGKIVRIVPGKSFGFIRDESGKEVFFHSSSVENMDFAQLQPEQAVEFEMEETPKGTRATKVRPGPSKRVFGAGLFD